MKKVQVCYNNNKFEVQTKYACDQIYYYMSKEPLGSEMTMKFENSEDLEKFNMEIVNYKPYEVVTFEKSDDINYCVIAIPNENNNCLKIDQLNDNSVKIIRINPAVIIKKLSNDTVKFNELLNDPIGFRRYKSYKNRLKKYIDDRKNISLNC